MVKMISRMSKWRTNEVQYPGRRHGVLQQGEGVLEIGHRSTVILAF